MTAKILYPDFELAGRSRRIASGMAASVRPAEGMLASLFNRYIATEHRCVMPDGNRSWYVLSSMGQARHGGNYVCAECGAPWRQHHG